MQSVSLVLLLPRLQLFDAEISPTQEFLSSAEEFAFIFSVDPGVEETSPGREVSLRSPQRADNARVGLSRLLHLKKQGKLCGYELLGFLNSTGQLVEDQCPQSPYVPRYWSIPEIEETFCFS